MWSPIHQRFPRLRCLIAVACGCASLHALAVPPETPAREFVAQTWTTQDGLPHNRINQVEQDAAGFLWIATEAGLTRFDGQKFKDFALPETEKSREAGIRNLAVLDPQTLAVIPASDEILLQQGGSFRTHPMAAATVGQVFSDLFIEPDGTMWIGTLAGQLYRWQAGEVQTFGVSDGLDARSPSFTFAQDGSGTTWVATGSFLGYYYDHHLVRFSETLPRIVTIAPARSGGLWAMVNGEVKKLESGKLTTVSNGAPWLGVGASVRHLFEDREGCLWLAATNHGIFWLRDGQLTHAELPCTNVQAITEDREGNIWLGTKTEGLTVLRRKQFACLDTAVGLPQKVSGSICEGAAGTMWLANGRGGLVRWRRGQIDHFQDSTGMADVYVVCPDGHGKLWVGTTTGLYHVAEDQPEVWEKIKQPILAVSTLLVTRGGDLWFAGNGGGLGRLRGETFEPVDYSPNKRAIVTALAEDTAGTIWAGSNFAGLLQFPEGKIVCATTPTDFWQTQINCLHLDRHGSLWVGTTRGLFLRDGAGFRGFSEVDGLSDHIILQMFEDNLDHLWLGSRWGYFHVAREELIALQQGRLARVNALRFGLDEGLSGAQPMTGRQPSAWRDQAGQLWFATQQGVITVDPSALSRPVPGVAPRVDEVRLDEQVLPAAAEMTIPPGRHSLEIRFAAPSFTSPSNVRFRHQMEGFDPSWIETAAGLPASYPNLPPGRYRLKVAARDGNGVWNEQAAQQTLVVQPFWWQQRWLQAAGIAAGLVALTLLVRHGSQVKLRRSLARIEGERALEKERARIARDVHDELGSGVTSVRFMISRLKKDSPDASQSRLVEQLTRQTQQLAFDLERVVWTVHPKSNSIDQLASFVGRFTQNLLQGSPIRCVLRRGENIPAQATTPEIQHHVLAVTKEAVNNVLKHAQADEVVIESRFEEGAFGLIIRDNGRGFDPDAAIHSERNGLSNMRQRMEEIGGHLHIHSDAAGTAIHLRVPVSGREPLPLINQ